MATFKGSKDDTYVYQYSPNDNYSTASYLSHIGYSGVRQVSLQRFDFGSLPAGAEIVSAQFTVYRNSGVSGTIVFSRILLANSGWTAAATWNYANGVDVAWAGSAGCMSSGIDYSATPLVTIVVGDGEYGTAYTGEVDLAEFALMVADNHGIRGYKANYMQLTGISSADAPGHEPFFTVNYRLGSIEDTFDDPVAETAAMLEIYWDDAWIDETDYLRMDGGFDVQRSMIDPLRGLASMGQAPLGTATFRVRNDDGRYSKTKSGSQAATYGLHGLPIRASLGYLTGAGQEYEHVFTGRIVDPQGTEAGETVTLYCRDEGETLLRQTASRIMNEGAQSSSLVATFAAEAGLGVGDYTLDQGLFLVPFAYLQEDNLWGEIQRVAASEGGLIFIDRAGLLRFWNAAHFDTLSSVATYDEALYAELGLRYDYDNAYNVVTVSYEPRQRSETVAAFALRRPVSVPINGTATETFEFRWPLAEFQSYNLTAVTGGGADISSSVTIDPSVPQYAQSWTVTFTNANTIHSAYITQFEVIGRVAEGRASETYTVDPGTVAGTKAAKKLSLGSNFYIQTPGQARLLGNLLSDRMADPVLTMQLVQCPALPTLELGDKITVQGDNNEINHAAIVTGLHYTFGPAAKCDITCVDASNLYGESGYFVIGTSALGTGKLFY